MIILGGTSNRYLASAGTLLFIAIIGFFDWLTGYEIALSVFYLVPITLIALHRLSNRIMIIAHAVFASGVWLAADTALQRPYQHFLIPCLYLLNMKKL
jgi:hypothetical protein